MEWYCHKTLDDDMMYVNKIPFFVIMSCHLKFRTVQKLDGQKTLLLLDAMWKVKQVYNCRGFAIHHVLMDGQFDLLQGDLASMSITLNMVSNDEHILEARWYI